MTTEIEKRLAAALALLRAQEAVVEAARELQQVISPHSEQHERLWTALGMLDALKTEGGET